MERSNWKQREAENDTDSRCRDVPCKQTDVDGVCARLVLGDHSQTGKNPSAQTRCCVCDAVVERATATVQKSSVPDDIGTQEFSNTEE